MVVVQNRALVTEGLRVILMLKLTRFADELDVRHERNHNSIIFGLRS